MAETVAAEPTPEELQARIAAGERVANRDEMNGEYFDDLVNLMTMQADSELAGAFGYIPFIAKAPSPTSATTGRFEGDAILPPIAPESPLPIEARPRAAK